MRSDNRDKHVLITGATTGFGYEFAKLFALDGYSLVLVEGNENRLREVADELTENYGVQVQALAEDLFTPGAPEKIYTQLRKWGVRIDIFVNDACQGEQGKFIDYDLHRDLEIIQMNVTSLVSLTKYFLQEMVARKEGKILHVASQWNKFPNTAVYGATKAFVFSFLDAVMQELEGSPVSMTVLMPGSADTEFFHKINEDELPSVNESDLSAPAEVAKDGYDALLRGESRIISEVRV